MRTLLYLLTLIATVLPLHAQTIRVATLNLHNYTLAHRHIDGSFAPDYPKPESEKAALHRILLATNADILCLQEIGPAPHLEELRRDLRTLGLDYPHSLHLAAADTSRCLAILSRIPWHTATRHTQLRFTHDDHTHTLKRGLIQLHFTTPTSHWTLYNLHLRSRLTEDPADPGNSRLRTAEATAIRNHILKHHAADTAPLYLIAGDFNDTKDSPPLRRFLKRGDTTPTLLLPTADAHGHTWTYHHKHTDTYTRIDYLLPSPTLLSHIDQQRAHILTHPDTHHATDHRLLYLDLHLP